MKISAERFIDRLMMYSSAGDNLVVLRFFCIASGVMYFYSLKMIELLLTIFKVA
jgi:hypothetical protein